MASQIGAFNELFLDWSWTVTLASELKKQLTVLSLRVKKIHREVSHRRRRLFFSLIPAIFGANYRGTILAPPASFSNLRFSSSPDPSFQRPFSGKPFNKREREREREKSERAKERERAKARNWDQKKKSQPYTIPVVSSLKSRKAISVQFSSVLSWKLGKLSCYWKRNEMMKWDCVRVIFFFLVCVWESERPYNRVRLVRSISSSGVGFTAYVSHCDILSLSLYLCVCVWMWEWES